MKQFNYYSRLQDPPEYNLPHEEENTIDENKKEYARIKKHLGKDLTAIIREDDIEDFLTTLNDVSRHILGEK